MLFNKKNVYYTEHSQLQKYFQNNILKLRFSNISSTKNKQQNERNIKKIILENTYQLYM